MMSAILIIGVQPWHHLVILHGKSHDDSLPITSLTSSGTSELALCKWTVVASQLLPRKILRVIHHRSYIRHDRPLETSLIKMPVMAMERRKGGQNSQKLEVHVHVCCLITKLCAYLRDHRIYTMYMLENVSCLSTELGPYQEAIFVI